MGIPFGQLVLIFIGVIGAVWLFEKYLDYSLKKNEREKNKLPPPYR